MARSFLPPEGPAAVCRFALSADGAWLASLDAHRRLRLYNLDAMQHHATLPMLDAVPTALEFDPGCSVLVVALALLSSTAGAELLLYDVEDKGGGRGGIRLLMPIDVPGTVAGIAFDPQDVSGVLCWGSQFLARVCIPEPQQEQEDQEEADNGGHAGVTSLVTRLSPILFAAVLGPATLLTVESPWIDVVEQLPEPIVRPKYGT